MNIATIVPEPHLQLTADDGYHLALAQVANDSLAYLRFYKERVERGDFVILDNGAAEEGAFDARQLRVIAESFGPSEVVLPDVVGDAEETLNRGMDALEVLNGWQMMAVPQGRSLEEYRACLEEMLTWPVTTIGVSKFAGDGSWRDRAYFLRMLPELLSSNKGIHLLGCVRSPSEAWEIEQRFPGRVRGIDSGIAAIATRYWSRLSQLHDRPTGHLDFLERLNWPLLTENVAYWRRVAAYGS